MWFKNLQIFRLAPWAIDKATLTARLEEAAASLPALVEVLGGEVRQ